MVIDDTTTHFKNSIHKNYRTSNTSYISCMINGGPYEVLRIELKVVARELTELNWTFSEPR